MAKTYFTTIAPDGTTKYTRGSANDYGYTAAGWRNRNGEWGCVTMSRSAHLIQKAGWSDVTIKEVFKSDKKGNAI